MGTDIINLHCKNEMVHFSNEIVVIVITRRSLDIFMIHLGLLLPFQQWTTQLQTGQQEIQLLLELLLFFNTDACSIALVMSPGRGVYTKRRANY